MCIGIPHELHPPDTFDLTDLCKTTYGLIYVYDTEVKACRVPKCSVIHDHCPKPSKCWRGKRTFIYYIRNRVTSLEQLSVAEFSGE